MKDSTFKKLWDTALEQPDLEMYIGEFGYPDYFDDIGDTPEKIIENLSKIYAAANMSIGEVIKKSGMTQKQFSEKFCIPVRTVENWSAGSRDCPDYLRLMLIRQLDLLEV